MTTLTLEDDPATRFRDTETKRKNVSETTRLRIWAQAAGRCVLCSTWLLDRRDHFWHAIPIGQIAHIVAASGGDNAPRGESTLDADQRALEDNMLLLCYSCHKRIDDAVFRDIYTVEFLTAKKMSHERRVREVTDFATLRPTSVLAVTAGVRGTIAPASPAQIAEALRRDGFTGMGDDTRNGMFTLGLPGSESDGWAWDAHRSEIDRFVSRVGEAVAAGDVSTLSVFALAPIPSLVYFGSRLDDKTETRLFARKRSDEVTAWAWNDGDVPSAFEVGGGGLRADATEAAVTVSISGTVSPERLPARMKDLPLVTLSPVNAVPSPDLIKTVAALDSFAKSWRELLAYVEGNLSRVRTLHVFAAVPVVAAITIGRHWMRDAQPSLVIYQRVADGYEPAMEVGE